MPNAVSLEELRHAEELEGRQGLISSLASPPHPRLCELGLEDDWYSRPGAPTTLSAALGNFLREAFTPMPPIYDIVLLDCPSHLSQRGRSSVVGECFRGAYDGRPGFVLGEKQPSMLGGE